MKRKDKINYYLDLAETTLERGTCIRRNYGAIIIKNDEIISTGYVGAPRGRVNCCDLKQCIREKLSIPRGERYELCRSVHAEQNAIINAGIKDIYIRDSKTKYRHILVQEYIDNDESLEGIKGY